MPLSIFNSLSLRPLQSTDVVIHLVGRCVVVVVGLDVVGEVVDE